MAINPKKDLSEWIRNKLNSLPEKDNQENNYRVGWQLLTYLVASAAEESINPKIRILGKLAKKGAKKSFLDLAVPKIFGWLENPSNNNPYKLTRSCIYCGLNVNYWDRFCPYCYRKLQ